MMLILFIFSYKNYKGKGLVVRVFIQESKELLLETNSFV